MNFADELAAFRDRTADPGYSALILLGTRQPTTAALLLGTLRLRRVAFLLTDETRRLPQEVAALLSCSADDWLCPAGNHDTTLDVYKGLRSVLTAWPDLDRTTIAVDVTGGLKPMSLGLEKAAHVLGLKTIYIQSAYETLPDGRVAVKPGSQRLEIPPDPYLVFGDIEAAEARRLFAGHDYAGAQRIFAELARRVPFPESLPYATYADLARAYAAWDTFDLPLAERVLTSILATNVLAGLDADRIRAQVVALQRVNTAGIQLRGSHGPSLNLLREGAIGLALLGALHANALRREAQGRFDIAALMRYRCLELMSQQRLATYGVLSERPDFREVLRQVPDLEDRYRTVVLAQGRRRFFGLPDRAFGLFVGYMLLAALDDPLVRGYAIGQIEQRSDSRNKSILAHGYRLIAEDEYRQFCLVVDELLDRYFDVIGQDRPAWETIHRFIALPSH